jgi:AcrR family transcriptional regulator
MKNQLRSEKTQTRIMQAAIRCFAEQGYAAAGVAEICTAAGVSKGAFYNHFESKNALFVTLLKSWLGDLDKSLEVIADQSTSFADMLALMAQIVEGIFDSYHEQIPILFEFWMQASRDEEIWKAAVEPIQHYQVFFTNLIQKGIDADNLENIDPEVGAQTVISLAIGLLMQSMLNPHSANWGEISQKSVQLLLNGISRRVV